MKRIPYLQIIFYLVSFLLGLLITSCSNEGEDPVSVASGVEFSNHFINPMGTTAKFNGGYPVVKGALNIYEYGFLYLSEQELDTLDLTLENGTRFIPESYEPNSEYEITSLEFQTTYAIRPFIIDQKTDSVYYGQVKTFTTFPPVSTKLTIYGLDGTSIIVEGILRNFTGKPYQQHQLLITRIPQPGHHEIDIINLSGEGDVRYFSYLNKALLTPESTYYVTVLIRIDDVPYYVGGTTILTP